MYSLFPLKRDGNRRVAITLQHIVLFTHTEDRFNILFLTFLTLIKTRLLVQLFSPLSPHLGERIGFAGAIKGDAKEGDFSDRLR